MARWLNPTGLRALPRVVNSSGVSLFAGLCASFPALTPRLQPPGGQSGRSEYRQAASRAFDDGLSGTMLSSLVDSVR